jgi:hypothetical protein
MEEFAELRIKRELNPLTGVSDVVSVEWVGDPLLRLQLPRDPRVVKTLTSLLPFRLEECRRPDDFPIGPKYYIRKDNCAGLAYNRFLTDWSRVLRVWHNFKRRLIMTLIVWGVGWVEQNQIIDWYCLGQKKP